MVRDVFFPSSGIQYGPAAFTHDGSAFAMICDDPRGPGLYLWNMPGAGVAHCFGNGAMVRSFAFSPDSKRVAIATVDGVIQIFPLPGRSEQAWGVVLCAESNGHPPQAARFPDSRV